MKKWNDSQVQLLRTMLANMIGEKSRVRETRGLDLNLIPKHQLSHEYHLLDFLYWCDKEEVPPTRDNIISHINASEIATDIEEYLNALAEYRTLDGQVSSHAYMLKTTLKHEQDLKIIREIADLYENESLSGQDAYLQAVPKFRQLSPRSYKGTLKTGTEVSKDWREYQRQNLMLAKKGIQIGPSLPWKATKKLIPYLRPKEVCIIAGKSKSSKSTLASIIAENMSHKQGYNVLFAHLETDAMTIHSRVMARKLLCPLTELEQGYYMHNDQKIWIDLDQRPYKEMADKVDAEYEEADEKRGRLWYYHCPGITVEELDIIVQEKKDVSEQQGRKLVVIIDYLQCFSTDHYKQGTNEVSGQNIAANNIKIMAETNDCYIILMAQDIVDDLGTPNIKIRGGNTAAIRSQVILKIERTMEALDDAPVMEGNKHKRDMLNNPMYYHRRGQMDSKVTFRVVGGNNIPTGETAEIVLVAGYFIAKDIERVEETDYATNTEPLL